MYLTNTLIRVLTTQGHGEGEQNKEEIEIVRDSLLPVPTNISVSSRKPSLSMSEKEDGEVVSSSHSQSLDIIKQQFSHQIIVGDLPYERVRLSMTWESAKVTQFDIE